MIMAGSMAFSPALLPKTLYSLLPNAGPCATHKALSPASAQTTRTVPRPTSALALATAVYLARENRASSRSRLVWLCWTVCVVAGRSTQAGGSDMDKGNAQVPGMVQVETAYHHALVIAQRRPRGVSRWSWESYCRRIWEAFQSLAWLCAATCSSCTNAGAVRVETWFVLFVSHLVWPG